MARGAYQHNVGIGLGGRPVHRIFTTTETENRRCVQYFAWKVRDLRHWLLLMSKKVINIKVNVKRSLCRPITRPEGSRRLRLTDFETFGHEGGKVVSPKHRPPLPPRKYSWYSFLLRVKSTPGP